MRHYKNKTDRWTDRHSETDRHTDLFLMRHCKMKTDRRKDRARQTDRMIQTKTDLFLTRHRMTQSASWMDRSASSSMSLLEPCTKIEIVLPGF